MEELSELNRLGITVKSAKNSVVFTYKYYEQMLYFNNGWESHMSAIIKHYLEPNIKLYDELERRAKFDLSKKADSYRIYGEQFEPFIIATVGCNRYMMVIGEGKYHFARKDHEDDLNNVYFESIDLIDIASYSDENINMADYFDFNENIKIALKN
jgi:hypothetical protein